MQIVRTGDDKKVAFAVTGSLSGTANSTVKLFEDVSAVMGRAPEEITFDLSRVMFIDSMSIGLLVGILLKGREKKIRVRLVEVSAQVRSILDTVKLKAMFPDLY